MTHELVSVSGFEPFEPEEWDYKFGKKWFYNENNDCNR